MSDDRRDVLEVLRAELQFVEEGGYDRSPATPWKWASTFRHSPSCVNFNDAARTHPCTDCLLIDFVPVAGLSQDLPCHHIPIGPAGETVQAMERQDDVLDLENTLASWLRATIQRIEQQRVS